MRNHLKSLSVPFKVVGLCDDNTNTTPGFDSQKGKKGNNFPIFHSIQIGSGTHQASHTVILESLYSELKRPGYETDNSPPSSAADKSAWSTPPKDFVE
jgi:hypothetical protein